MKFKYFAYGSNMLVSRILDRCPSAKVIGPAAAEGFDLTFTKPSKDGSGKASIVSASGTDVPGVIFEIDVAELNRLDRAEGAGFGYERYGDFKVRVADGTECEVTTYLATEARADLAPYDWYLALVVAGAKEHSFGQHYINTLKSVPYLIDSCPERPSRTQAMEALRAAGWAEYDKLLKA